MHQGWSLYIATALFFAGVVCAESPPEPRIETFEGLEVGESVNRERPSQVLHEYRWDFSSPRYLRGMVLQGEVDLLLRWLGPEGQVLREIDGGDTAVEENFALRALQTGQYRLQVVPKIAGQDPGGSYVFKLYELSDPRPGDVERVEAWEGFQEGRRTYWQAWELEAAGKIFSDTLQYFEAIGDAQGEAATLQQLGWLAPEVRQSKRLYEDALARLGDVQSGLRYDILADLASVETDLGNMTQALALYQECLDFFRLSGNDSSRADTLSNMGLLLRDMGDSEAARDALEEALELHRTLKRDRVWEVKTLNSLGLLAEDLGDLPQALERFTQAHKLAQEMGHEGLELRAYLYLGRIHQRVGEIQESLKLLEQAWVKSQGVYSETAFDVLQALASTWMQVGDGKKALEYAERAVEFSRESGAPKDLASSLSTLAFIHLALRETERAQARFEEALVPSRESSLSYLQGYILMGLARCKRLNQEVSEAQTLLEEAQRLATRSDFVSLPIGVMIEQGDLYRARGDFHRSRVAFDEAEQLAREAALTPLRAHILARRSRLERDWGHLEEARRQIEKALELHESLRSRVTNEELRAYFLAQRLDDYRFYVDLLMDLHRTQFDAGYDAMALAASERARARTLIELLAEVRVDPNRDLSDDLRRRIRSTTSRLTQVQKHLLTLISSPAPDAAEVEDFQQEREEILAELDRLELEVRRGSQKLAPEPLGLEGIQALLGPDTGLLEYVVGADYLYVFVVTRTDLAILPLSPVEGIQSKVRVFREELATPGQRTGKLDRVAYELFEVLLSPAMGHLENLQRLIVVPTEDLFYVPFEALRLEPPHGSHEARDYVLSRWPITYVPSATTLAVLAGRESAPDPKLELLAFANPGKTVSSSVSGRPGRLKTRSAWTRQVSSLQPLEGVRHEVESIARLFPSGSVSSYFDEDASEARVKGSSELSRARRVHFAAHGILDEENPAYSGLFLKGHSEDTEDGLLQVHEIFDLKLSADLVVLSACNTGLGKHVRGEGLLGLSRAFFYAGTSQLAVSLWQVEDAATAELMTSFYRHLLDRKPSAEALKLAKMDLLQRASWRHPYYWAPFVLIGR